MFSHNILKKTLLYGPVAIILLFWCTNSQAHRWMAPPEAAQKQNPIPLNQVSISSGQEIYIQNCAVCHGAKARGLSAEATGLPQDTPNLKQRLKNHTDGDFHWKIQNGKGLMPSFKEDLSDNDIWNVINYFKSLKEPKE